MLLGLTILLVLLAWTLGNTIARSTNRSPLEAHTSRLLHRKSVSRFACCMRSSLTNSRPYVIEMLRRLELQPALATASPPGDFAVTPVATTCRSSDCCALHIGRTSVGFRGLLNLSARDSYNSYRCSLPRSRGAEG